jgi:hypothetical protein
LTLGYNWQAGKAVIGLEGEGGAAHLTGSGNFGSTIIQPNAESETFGSLYGVLSARLGVSCSARSAPRSAISVARSAMATMRRPPDS